MPGEQVNGPSGERAASVRAAIEAEMRALAETIGRDEAEARTLASERLAAIARAELERALADFGRRASESLERAQAELAQANEEALAALAEGPAGELTWRQRRHELKLVRAESSARVRRALEKLERRGAALIAELDARLARATAELDARAATADGIAAGIERTAERVAEIERGATAAARQAALAAIQADHAAELESRIRAAARVEATAAARISEAERRLLDLARGG